MTPANDNNEPNWPRGLSRSRAAAYVGVSLTIWDKMTAAGEMPKPKRAYGRTIWDKRLVDAAFDVLDGGNSATVAGEIIYEFAA